MDGGPWGFGFYQRRAGGSLAIRRDEREGPAVEIVSLELPESLMGFVRERVAEGGYGGVGEYVCELIRADWERRRGERVDALLLEGLNSGTPIEVTPEYWETKKRKLTERLSRANGNQRPDSH